MKQPLSWLLTLAFVALAAFGCSTEDHPAVAPVTGRVLYQGQPVANANVTFMNESAARAATGVTNEQGEFRLTTFEPDDGAAPGLNKVAVSKAAPTAAVTDLESEAYAQAMQQIASPTAAPKSEIPMKYADTNSTPLSMEVDAEQDNHFEITLED